MHTRSERLVASAPRWRLRMRALTLLAVLLMLAVFMIGWLRPATPLPPSALSLQDFRVTLPAVVVAGIGDDLSGITHDGDHDRLLAITNSGPEQLLVLDRQGSLLAQHALIGFKDTEDLAWLGDGLLAIVEERVHRISILPLPSGDAPLRRADARQLTLGIGVSDDNKGFEGIAYDRSRDLLYLVKERDPQRLYRVAGLRSTLQGDLQLDVQDLTAWIDDAGVSSDLSAITVEPRSGHLVLLSDESRLLFELGPQGQLLSQRSLGRGVGLQEPMPQPEGVILDDRGELFVVSEPNLFYRLAR
ncbi:SdiA-regulated domain-containing protein [Pseudomonas abyssi]|nr:SdiA-regulated domain-containing protein [Halopseudomonas gallaeciensis]MAG66372.1 DNA-binding protein [Pseudomonadales bacterium]